MAYITNDAVTGVDARGIMEWREGVRACGSQSTFPATAVPTFEVSGILSFAILGERLIKRHHDVGRTRGFDLVYS